MDGRGACRHQAKPQPVPSLLPPSLPTYRAEGCIPMVPAGSLVSVGGRGSPGESPSCSRQGLKSSLSRCPLSQHTGLGLGCTSEGWRDDDKGACLSCQVLFGGAALLLALHIKENSISPWLRIRIQGLGHCKGAYGFLNLVIFWGLRGSLLCK